jgi:hypothetical protein
MGLPPFDVGGEKLTVAWAIAAVAAAPVGAPGTVPGVTGPPVPVEGADAGPVPQKFVAVTVKV